MTYPEKKKKRGETQASEDDAIFETLEFVGTFLIIGFFIVPMTLVIGGILAFIFYEPSPLWNDLSFIVYMTVSAVSGTILTMIITLIVSKVKAFRRKEKSKNNHQPKTKNQ